MLRSGSHAFRIAFIVLATASFLGACGEEDGASSGGTGARAGGSGRGGGSGSSAGGSQGSQGRGGNGGNGGDGGNGGADASSVGGASGSGGSAGNAGVDGNGGNGGNSGADGSVGNGGTLGNGGNSGSSGSSGSGGSGGNAGSGGNSGASGTGGSGGAAGTAGNSGASGTGGSSGRGGSGGNSGNTGSGGSGGSAGTGGNGGSGAGGTGGTAQCMVGQFLQSIGQNRMLVGASMSDATAVATPFDVRYLYLAGGIFSGTGPCSSCASGCQAGGQSCANSNPAGCAWWGCWQWDQVAPGQYLRDFLTRTETDGQIPMITYYQVLQASGANEGAPEVAATNNVAFMTRYLADWRFVLTQIGQKRAFLHIEPDFWGYAEQVNEDPRATQSAVASANATDCAGQENNIAGLGRCMIAMARKYAPNAKVGLHASAWGTKIDVHLNSNASFDIAGEARKLGAFMSAAGAATGDFVVIEASDRDAGFNQRWWDATNATLPNFNQAFTWAKALAERVGKPLVWWQLPVGNMSLASQNRDNRVDYFFGHTAQIVGAHGAVIAFGAGAGGQATPESDGGNLIAKVRAYDQAGGQTPCP